MVDVFRSARGEAPSLNARHKRNAQSDNPSEIVLVTAKTGCVALYRQNFQL